MDARSHFDTWDPWQRVTAPRPCHTEPRWPPTAELRAGRWRRTSRGWYVPADIEPDNATQRIAETVALIPEYGGLTGWAALHWAGGVWFDGYARGGREECPVPIVTAGQGMRRHPGVRPVRERLRPDQLVEVNRVPMTDMARSVDYAMRYAGDEREAVVACEMAMFSDLVTLAEVDARAEELNGWIGVPQMRAALDWVCENAWSPPEVHLRLAAVLDAGLPPLLCNVPVFTDDGRLIGVPDLFEPGSGLALEYDGALHLSGAHRERDVVRAEAFAGAGITLVPVLAGQLVRRARASLVLRLQDAYDRAARTPRRWTLERPPWWTDTDTVEQRRALASDQRRWLLGHRRRLQQRHQSAA